MRRLSWVALVCLAGMASAWEEPARGTALRAALLDAVRPHVEWMLAPPVEFVVWDLRREGDLAFFSGWAQRPGGGPIDMAATPAVRRGELDHEAGDGPAVQALYKLSGDTWVAVLMGLSPSERWYSTPDICAVWRSVIPEACGD